MSNDSFGLSNLRFNVPVNGVKKFEVTGVQPFTDPITRAALLKAKEPKPTLWKRLSKPSK